MISRHQNDGNRNQGRPENFILRAGRHQALHQGDSRRAIGGAGGDNGQQWRHYYNVSNRQNRNHCALSIIGLEDLARPDLKECIEAVDIMVLYWRPRWTCP